jgi:hypothetical protein
MKTMTITIERKPLNITVDGKELQVEELGRRLAFGRKPVDSTTSQEAATTPSTSRRRCK